MPRIHQLPASVVTKIAAGEVIERPGSVVKELVENSIDAGAKRIEVDIEQGGVELIRVVDDGCGIHPNDLELAFSCHATSKLGSADDLFNIETLGFRGEALASIGGVARVTLQSRPPDLPCGAEIQCVGSELSTVRAWNGSAGTRLEVRHLFFNTPVRRKFLRTTATEVGHVTETIQRIALSHPTLHLILRHNSKLVYEIPTSAGLLDRVGLFYGADVRDSLYAIEGSQGSLTISGYIADPSCERGSTKLQYVFLNGRAIRDKAITHALQEAYRGLIMQNRHPVAFLFLEVPPDMVDVNVHPTKAEVRFRDGQVIYHLVRSTVRNRLTQANLVPNLQAPLSKSEQRRTEIETRAGALAPWEVPPPTFPSVPVVTLIPVLDSSPWKERPAEPQLAPTGSATRPVSKVSRSPSELFNEPARPLPEIVRPAPPTATPQFEVAPTGPLASWPTLADLPKALQVHDSYLVVETPEGMLVIDQHALHERILFEKLKARFREGPLERQKLLIPEPIDFTPDQASRALEFKLQFDELGLEVEDFGGGTLLLSSYPTLLRRASPEMILRTVVDFVTRQDRPPTREQMLNDACAMMACKAACKAGDRLTPEEIAELLAQRDLALDPHHCPHGRPTSLLFSRQELDKQFRRT